MKIALLDVARKRCAHAEDLVAESSVFSVEFFNALFVSMCMSGSNSRVTTAVLIAIDLLQIAHTMHAFEHRSKSFTRAGAAGANATKIDFEKARASCLAFAFANKQLVQTRCPGIRFDGSNGLAFHSSIAASLQSQASSRRTALGRLA